jgi:mannose-6-phosphate isomerase-like protein (cupin superfamily)
MSAYKKINLREIDNSSQPNSGVQARFSRSKIESEDVGLSLFSYDPNSRSKKAHSHKKQEEAYVVVNGSGRILLDGEIVVLKLWDVIRVSHEVVRAFEAGNDGMELIAVGGPKPEGGDGVMQEADWGDK